jgi:RHS repeat-associated protein
MKWTEYKLYYFNANHLCSGSLITDGSGNTYQTLAYAPFGEILVNEFSGDYDEPYKFGGHIKDNESNLSYYGARYFDDNFGSITPDAMTFKRPSKSAYLLCLNNPIRYIDPDGNWEWDTEGNLTAQKGDNAWTLAKFLGTNVKNSLTMLNRGGYSVNDKGILNLKIGDKLARNDLWVGFRSGSEIVVNNTNEAVNHYFNGNGQSADVGDQSTIELLQSNQFQEQHNLLTTDPKANTRGSFNVDMTNLTFHIGRTNVDYNITNNGNSNAVTYTLFSRDGFWDPDFISEKTLGKKMGIDRFKPDGMGPNLERFGGQPYYYLTRTRTFFFKPPTK